MHNKNSLSFAERLFLLSWCFDKNGFDKNELLLNTNSHSNECES